MNSPSRTAAAAVAAAAFVVAGATVVGHKIPDQHWGTRGAVLDIAFAIGMACAAFALPVLAGLLGLRRPGTAGIRLAQGGQAAMAVESIASTIHGGNTLGPVFMLGLLAALAGYVLVAIDGFGARRARALAPVPLAGLLLGIAAGNQGGAIALGLVWAGLAVAVNRRPISAAASLATAPAG